MTFSVPEPHPARRHDRTTGMRLPKPKRRFLFFSARAAGPRMARRTFVPVAPEREPRTA